MLSLFRTTENISNTRERMLLLIPLSSYKSGSDNITIVFHLPCLLFSQSCMCFKFWILCNLIPVAVIFNCSHFSAPCAILAILHLGVLRISPQHRYIVQTSIPSFSFPPSFIVLYSLCISLNILNFLFLLLSFFVCVLLSFLLSSIFLL